MERIVVFYGSNRDYKKFLSENDISLDKATLFPEIISQYNETIRASNTGYIDQTNKYYTDDKLYIENVVIMQNDFASVLDHVISNFSHIISLAHEMDNLFLQNPPKRVVESLLSSFPEEYLEYEYSKYSSFSINQIKAIKKKLDLTIIGQKAAKFDVLSSLYQLSKKKDNKPIVLHFYGPSGVGKTELAKSISDFMGGELLKIQFSMMQTEEANKYIFGDQHSRASFAKDLISRESNIVLIDEFDKVHPNFYNAFYEVFDEGIYRDLNYSVNVKNTIFILTSNFSGSEEINKRLGPAMASRIGKSVRFDNLNVDSIKRIIEMRYCEIYSILDKEEKLIIDRENLLSWYLIHSENFTNIRELKSRIEQDIYNVLTNNFLNNKEGKEE
ncbi:AAA family ATPase [Enterococcus thailandicus]|uniref:AAA family ATPase n=1 Tax=Enterococcus thailandicus TaxID=417368 RepID=UPI0022E7F530|nr:AAA family ATPase [Enterococcus thailandicus]